ncbi:MAG: lamin tail domain-containing protein, partial [candidate division WOR-3 bacterium]
MRQHLIKSKIFFASVLLIFLFWNFGFINAQNQICSPEGYSVFFINGIFTDKNNAENDRRKLDDYLPSRYNNEEIFVKKLHNPSHLGGLGDLTQTLSQMMEKPITDLDFKDILIDLHSQLKTQKLLLVGYSQGTFYANEVYNYLIKNGISPRSAAVYNIATPASYVAGEGQYLTSATDKVISLARDIARTLKIKEPLPPNINIPLSSKEAANKYGGHSFQDVYLANASQRIISEIQQSLNNLQSTNSGLNITNYSNNLNNQNNGCFTKPSKDFFYWAEKTLIKALDLGSGVLSYFFDGINFTADKILDFASFLGDKTADGIRYIFSIIAQNLPHLAAMPNYIEVVGNSQNAVNVRSNENIENIDNKSIQTPPLPKVLIADNPLLNTPQDIVVVDTEILSQKIYQQTLAYINQYFKDYNFNDDSNNKAVTAAPNNQSGFFPFILIPGAPAPNIIEINKNNSQTTQGPAYSSAYSSANSSDSVNNDDNNDDNNSDNAAATLANSAMPEIIKESEFKSKVLINEIFWQDNQWLELKNITDKEIDLNNWSLSWQGYQLTFNENDKIAPGGFFLLEYNESDIIPALRADKIFTAPLGSFGEKIILKDNAGALVDQADFSNGWLKSQDDAQARSLQRVSAAAWDLYLSDGRADNCVPQLFDKNNNIILGTPKKENNFDAALSSNPTTISQTTILQNDNFWCRRQSPYTLEFSEYAHPTIDLNASLDIEAGTEIIFKYTTPVTGAPYGFSSNERHKAFEIKGKLTARGNLDKKIKISFNPAFEFNKTYLDLLRFKETSQAELSHLDINISFENPTNFNLFNLESSSFSLKDSLLKIQNNGSWSYGVYIIRPIAPVLENNYFEGFSYPIYLWSSGELQNGQNAFAAPIFKNNSGQNNKYNGITIFSGNGAATNIGNDWTLFENSPNFPYLISSSYRQPLTILKGANLKIMPGVKIMAATCPSLYYLIEIFGTIDAQGTAEKPI